MKKKTKATIDIDFLPENLKEKINRVFDNYFGLGLASKVRHEGNLPNFPNQVSSLDSNQLADVHSQYTAWFGYVSDKLKYINVACTIVNNEAQEAFNYVLSSLSGLKINLKEKEARAKGDEGYKVLKDYLIQLEAFRTMLDAETTTLEKQMMSLARELRRRENYKQD
jgi:hypothetical protein